MKIIYPSEYQAEKDQVTLCPPDPQWLSRAREEIDSLKKLLPPDTWIDIQHIGSTAIPNITAKPIIDMAIAVEALEAIDDTWKQRLATLGYLHLAITDMPDRIFFVKGLPPFGQGRTHHLHLVEATSKQWQDWITFRDYVGSHPNVARQYAYLKKHLHEHHGGKREVYTLGKTQFINEVLAAARKN
jgi:GrpB-like predicted nucleotidyltransferase (UPF0157 family)